MSLAFPEEAETDVKESVSEGGAAEGNLAAAWRLQGSADGHLAPRIMSGFWSYSCREILLIALPGLEDMSTISPKPQDHSGLVSYPQSHYL